MDVNMYVTHVIHTRYNEKTLVTHVELIDVNWMVMVISWNSDNLKISVIQKRKVCGFTKN